MSDNSLYNDESLYTPIELYKLCANTILKNIYHPNINIFTKNLYKYNFPKEINDIIFDRYFTINHIINIKN